MEDVFLNLIISEVVDEEMVVELFEEKFENLEESNKNLENV